jgi:hypothetical protein
MYNTNCREQFQLWRRYYTSTDTATTTIQAAGLVEGIPSSLSWDTQQSNLNAGECVGDMCTIIFIVAASAINEIHIIRSLGNTI